MKKLIIFFFFFIVINALSGQITITGYITDENSKALPNINILVYPAKSNVLVAFGISGSDGNFTIKTQVPGDSLDIKTSSIHYAKSGKRIANKNNYLSISLKPDIKQLEAFTVRASPIEKKGDTLSYLVSSFNKSSDRSISDVLKRMPGIEVEKNGKILYQGMPIQKFYVEGLDLMGGKYTVVSDNLPAGSVATVEIYENHQPLRILENRVSSQQASMNLKLKQNITTTGIAKTGAGARPLLWDVNLTPMTFTKNFQLVSSYQTNNTGNDVSQQITNLTSEDMSRMAEMPTERPEYLSVCNSQLPDFNENRHLNNNIHMLNLNGLIKSGKDLQMRANVFYVNDYLQYESKSFRSIFLANDTLSLPESIRNKNFSQTLYSELTFNQNAKAAYFNNKLKFKADWGRQFGVYINNNETVQQHLNNPFQSLSNDLTMIYPLNEKLLKISSYITLDNNKSELKVNPGSFANIVNQGLPYDEARQDLCLKRLFTDQSASIIFGEGAFSITPRIGIIYRTQTLESGLVTIIEGVESNQGIDYANALKAYLLNAYAQTGIEFKKSNFTIKANLPISYQYYWLSDAQRHGEQKSDKLLFDPGFSIYYKFKDFWMLSSSWAYYNRLGDIDQQYYGFIMKNYLNLSQNAAPVSLSVGSRYSTSASYRNPINSLFCSFHYLFNTSLNNLIYKNQINQDGSLKMQAIEFPNRTRVHSIVAQGSKYLSKALMTIGFQLNYTYQQGISFVNNELLATNNQLLLLKPYIDARLLSWLNAEYSLSIKNIQSGFTTRKSNQRTLFIHSLNIYTLFRKNNQLIVTTEYYSLDHHPYFFADLKYRYSFTKQRIDLETSWINIFNSTEYINYQAGAYTVYETTYKLRPSQLIIRANFRF